MSYFPSRVPTRDPNHEFQPSRTQLNLARGGVARTRTVLAAFLLATTLIISPAFSGVNPCIGGTGPTVITINTTTDPNDSSLSKTCASETGGDGLCSLRRAMIEASKLPRSQRPYVIAFDLDINEAGYDAATQTWDILISNTLPEFMDTIGPVNGKLGCTAFDGTTQPIGRPLATGPRIFLDDGGSFGGEAIRVFSPNNAFRDLGLKGGVSIQLLTNGAIQKANETLIDNLWIGLENDGQSLALQSPAQPSSLSFAQGIFVDTDNNTIENSVISGAFSAAIFVNGGNSNTLIENNYFGTRSDGTLPFLESTNIATELCEASMTHNLTDNWYGGWGVNILGTAHIVRNNTFAGMQNLRSLNDTVPIALQTAGNDHDVSMNVFGEDSNGDPRGTCGLAIHVGDGQGTDVLDNLINGSRSSFDVTGADDQNTAILYNADQFGDGGEVTIRRNLVSNGPENMILMGPVVPDALRLFSPPIITSIVGTAVQGETAAGSDCVGCTIDLYRDDNNPNQEAFEWLGSAMVQGNGSFSFTMASPLGLGMGIRVTATTNDSVAIAGFGAGTTTEAGPVMIGPPPASLIFADGFESGDSGSWN